MELTALLRMVGGLGTVLGILAGALWLVRRYDLRLPGRTGVARVSRLQLIEKLPVDARRAVCLVRRDGREHLILIAPEGHLVIESAIVLDDIDQSAETERQSAQEQAELSRELLRLRTDIANVSNNFSSMVDKAGARAGPVGTTLKALLLRPSAPEWPVASPERVSPAASPKRNPRRPRTVIQRARSNA